MTPVTDLSDDVSERVIARFSIHRFLIRLRCLDDGRAETLMMMMTMMMTRCAAADCHDSTNTKSLTD